MRRNRISWAIRILLIILLWLPQPILFIVVVFGGIKLPDWYGFLGGWFTLLVGILLGEITYLVLVVGKKKEKTRFHVVFCVVLVALIVANHVQAAGMFVDSETYDVQTANSMNAGNTESNLEHGYEAYRPFASDFIARLDEPATLSLEAEDLPRVDSATALLPLASSIVTATYPADAVTVQWEQGNYDQGFKEGYQSGFMDGARAKAHGNPEYWFDIPIDGSNRGVYFAEGFDQGYEAGFASGYKQGKEDTNEIRVDRSAVAIEAAEALAAMPKPPDATFQYNNSSEGFTRLADGRTDVFLGTKSDQDQADYAASKGVEFEYTPIGREGFVFLVNADNPVDSLTIDQVKGIYAGRITNWKQVRGNDEPIVAYQRNENSGSQSMMRRFMADTPLMQAPARLAQQSMGGLVSTIADYDNGAGAIGYSFRYYVTDLVGQYNVKLLAIEGIEPTAKSISNETYPITGEFYAVTRAGDDSPALTELIDWIRGLQGQELVERSGYARL